MAAALTARYSAYAPIPVVVPNTASRGAHAATSTRYSLECLSSWRTSLQLQHQSSSVLLAGMENGCRGRSRSLSFRMESTTDGSRIPRLAEFARTKDQLFRSYNAESRMEHPAFAKQSSLVDETGIEPATSSLRTVGKIS